jgi:hypothetical protein
VIRSQPETVTRKFSIQMNMWQAVFRRGELGGRVHTSTQARIP